MKKLFTLLLVLMSFTTLVRAQLTSGGPDPFGYVWRNDSDAVGPVYSWIDIVGIPGATQVKREDLGDDNTAGPFPIGFDFHYYWYDRTTFRVGSNGYIIFNNGAIAAPFPQVPSTLNPHDYIAAMASDLTFVSSTGVPITNADCWFYTTPNADSLIVSWISVPFWSGAAPSYLGENTFQIILCKNDSSITFQYQTQSGIYQNVVDFMTIGIENVSGTIGLQHTHDFYPVPPLAVKFYYPDSVTLVITDAATSYNDTDGTGGLFIPQNGNNFILKAEVQNVGNVELPPFNVTSQIRDINQSVVVTNTVQTDTLQAGQKQLFIHSNQFTPSFAGTYTFVTNTQLGNDLVFSNNQLSMELRVVDTTQASLTLQFEDATASTGSLGWDGGAGGAGYYIIPPYYPCTIDSLQAFITTNINLANYYMELFDDDGPFSTPGTLLDSVMVINPQPAGSGEWFTSAVSNPVTITSGGFYVSWNMNGLNINLGLDLTPPFSNRTYEVLGSSWAIYRSREFQDLMIRAVVSPPTGTGIDQPAGAASAIGNFFPNPATDQVSLTFTMGDGARNVTYTVYDMQGRQVTADEINLSNAGKGTISIATRNLSEGMYNCKLIVDGKMINRRFIITR
jgi:hypothetical protein